MGLLKPDLRRILDRDDPLFLGDELGQGVQEGGLPGAGSTGDDDVAPLPDGLSQVIRGILGHRPDADEFLEGERFLPEFADRQARPGEANRRYDRVDA